MKITNDINSRAWAIRRLFAEKWSCKSVKEIPWKYCFRLAKYKGSVEQIWLHECNNQDTKKTVVYVKSATKETKKRRVGRPCKNNEIIPFIESCVTSGNMTRKQVLDAMIRRFPELKKSSLSVTLSNCGNGEKTRLTDGRTFIKDENKKLVFA